MTPNERYEVTGDIAGTGGRLKYVIDKVSLQRRVRKDLTPENFKKELHMYQKLEHPAFPLFFDAYLNETGGHIIMEYVEGMTIEKILKENGPLSEEKVMRYAISLCEALIFLHSLEPLTLHLDLKPSNLIITKKDKLILLDPGSARECFADRADRRFSKRKNPVYGTVGYAAPEQYMVNTGKAGMICDERTDVYGMGRTIRRMMTGYSRRNHVKETKQEKQGKQVKQENSYQSNETYSSGLIQIVKKAVSSEPARRFQSVQELKEALLRASFSNKESAGKPALVLVTLILAFLVLLFGILFWDKLPFSEKSRMEDEGTVTKMEEDQEEKLKEVMIAAKKYKEEKTLRRMLNFEEDFTCSVEELKVYLPEAEELIDRNIRNGTDRMQCVEDLHALCHLYLLREEELGEVALMRIPELARSGILLVHEEYEGADKEKKERLLSEEEFFLECLIVRLEESDNPDDQVIKEDYEKRLKELQGGKANEAKK